MKVSIYNLGGDKVGDMNLNDEIFQVPVREDILSRVVEWQLAKRRAGTHKTKQIGDVSGTTRKPHNQKGTGRARQGSLRSPQFRGGAVIFGPVVRDHAYSLPKKVRRLALKSALSARLADNQLMVVDALSLQSGKTRDVLGLFEKKSVLMIGGEDVSGGLSRAIANLPRINLLPRQGINVYDILRHDKLILSREAVDYIENWLAVS
jgi:large subunit ribosomal protein L4